MDSNTWDWTLLSLRALGSVISTVVPIEQESARALQLEEDNWDKENKINELKVPGTAEVENYSSLLLTQSFFQTCHLRCPQLTPMHTFQGDPGAIVRLNLNWWRNGSPLRRSKRQRESSATQRAFPPRRSNLRCLLPSLMVETECTRTVQNIACCIARKASGLPNWIEIGESYMNCDEKCRCRSTFAQLVPGWSKRRFEEEAAGGPEATDAIRGGQSQRTHQI